MAVVILYGFCIVKSISEWVEKAWWEDTAFRVSPVRAARIQLDQ